MSQAGSVAPARCWQTAHWVPLWLLLQHGSEAAAAVALLLPRCCPSSLRRLWASTPAAAPTPTHPRW